MRLIHTNNDQLEIFDSGKTALIVGGLFAAAGIGLAIWTLLHLASMAWWVSLIGVGVAVIGALALYSASSHRVILRRSGLSEITDQKLITKKITTQQFDASQIVAVQLNTSIETTVTKSETGSTTKRERLSILCLALNDGAEVIIGQARSGTSGFSVGGINTASFGAAPLSKEAKQIADFYGVQLQVRDDGQMGGLESIVGAVGAVRQGMAAMQQAAPMVATPSSPTVAMDEPPMAAAPVAPTPVFQPQPAVAQPPAFTAPEPTYQPQQPSPAVYQPQPQPFAGAQQPSTQPLPQAYQPQPPVMRQAPQAYVAPRVDQPLVNPRGDS